MKNINLICLSILSSLMLNLTSCSSQDEPLLKIMQEETVTVRADLNFHFDIDFKYDKNLNREEAFAKEVSSVAVWAFDKSGKLVWSHYVNLDNATSEDFTLPVKIAVGEYDFVAWCGLTPDLPLLSSALPTSLSQLSLTLPIVSNECNIQLPETYNAVASNVMIRENGANSLTLNLTKVTKHIKILLESTKSEIIPNDIDIRITDAPNTLEWDMTPKTTSAFKYTPYSIRNGNIETDLFTLSVLQADFSTLRLTDYSTAKLFITRKSDNKEIMIPLVDHFLKQVPMFSGRYTPQEYLDRRSNYSITISIDSYKLQPSDVDSSN
ncbi:FimB/Mfa2 family fimbrial subunit [bacterium]|nr:FimB/Mfa2 family fimbrial subunit [bacterium]